MSVKIYEAYRLRRKGDLWPFVRDVKKRGVQNARLVFRRVYQHFAETLDVKNDAFKTFAAASPYKGDLAKLRLSYAQTFVREQFRAQVMSPNRDTFDFTASIVFREHKNKVYLIPYRGLPFEREGKISGDILKFLKRDKRIEDFSYWNNTDQPEGISAREWSARGRKWDEIDKNWQDFLVLEICSWESFWTINPYSDMLRELDSPKGS